MSYKLKKANQKNKCGSKRRVSTFYVEFINRTKKCEVTPLPHAFFFGLLNKFLHYRGWGRFNQYVQPVSLLGGK